MDEPFIGSEAMATGQLTRYQLRSRYVPIAPDVYIARETPVTALLKAKGAWLWSRRAGVLAGRSAAALHRAKWVAAVAPAEILYDNRHSPKGIRAWADRIADDEIMSVNGMSVTTPARTALDIACRNPRDAAVAQVDALAHATDLKCADVELLAQRYGGRRGIRRVTDVLDLVDAGAESPRETWVRLVLIDAGFPRPATQVPVYDEGGYVVARLDLGWEDIKVAVDYDGDHHRTDRKQFRHDIRRNEEVAELGWINVRITAEDTRVTLMRRAADARARRT